MAFRKILSNVRHNALGEEVVADVQFTESSFAECFRDFAECLLHSAKQSVPVVYTPSV